MSSDPLAVLEQETLPQGAGWMLTMADLLSLILTFFVMLYSMSELENTRWHEISVSLSQRLNPGNSSQLEEPAAKLSISREDETKGADIEYLKSVLADKFRDMPRMHDLFTMIPDEDRLLLRPREPQIFVAGTAELTEQGLIHLQAMVEILRTVQNRIDIHAYATEDPLDFKIYTSRYELALARANAAAQALSNAGYEYKMHAYGRKEAPVTHGENSSNTTLQALDVVVSPAER